MSHRLPRPLKPERREGRQHPLQPAVPTGNSLWRTVTTIHSLDLQTEKYTVEMSTGASSLARWGTLDPVKLAGTLCRSQALYLPAGIPQSPGRSRCGNVRDTALSDHGAATTQSCLRACGCPSRIPLNPHSQRNKWMLLSSLPPRPPTPSGRR